MDLVRPKPERRASLGSASGVTPRSGGTSLRPPTATATPTSTATATPTSTATATPPPTATPTPTAKQY